MTLLMKRDPHLLSAGRETARATVPRVVNTVVQRGRFCLHFAEGLGVGDGGVDIPVTR